MKVISRRTVLGLATVGLFPWWQRSSSGQGPVAIVRALLAAAGAVLTTMGIVDLIKKWTADVKCGVDVRSLEALLLHCQTMDRQLNQEASGLLSRLAPYSKRPVAKSAPPWADLRLELAAFLNTAEHFLNALDYLLQKPFKKFAEEKQASDTRSALMDVRAALTALAARPKPPTEAELAELLPLLGKLAAETKRSAASMISAVEQRRSLECPS